MKLNLNQLVNLTKAWYIPLDHHVTQELANQWTKITTDLAQVTLIDTTNVVISNSLDWISNQSLALDQPECICDPTKIFQTAPCTKNGYIVIKNAL